MFQFQFQNLELVPRRTTINIFSQFSYCYYYICLLLDFFFFFTSCIIISSQSFSTFLCRLVDNPICEGTGVGAGYCAVLRPNSPFIRRFSSCTPVSCSSDKISSPTCKCAYPFTGTIHFYSFSFSNLGNPRYFDSLNGSLMDAFLASSLPVESVIASDPAIDEYSYLRFKLQVFPSFEERFNRTGGSFINTLLNRQNITLLEQYFGPFYFLQENYNYSGICGLLDLLAYLVSNYIYV